MTEIEIRGNTATFTAFDMKWTIIDGGEGYARDTVKIDDGFQTREMKLYAGDFKIVDAEIAAHAVYQDCVKCHEGQAAAMRAKGGKHNTVGCGDCHVGTHRKKQSPTRHVWNAMNPIQTKWPKRPAVSVIAPILPPKSPMRSMCRQRTVPHVIKIP